MNKFKVGDTVRVAGTCVATDRPHIGKVAKLIKRKGDHAWMLEGIGIHMFDTQLELVKPKNFTKADMQIGQLYLQTNGCVYQWREDEDFYNDNLCYTYNGDRTPDYDIIEVYPMQITPIWKRSEPKYRVKTELTKEQAEKLGLEFCEVIK